MKNHEGAPPDSTQIASALENEIQNREIPNMDSFEYEVKSEPSGLIDTETAQTRIEEEKRQYNQIRENLGMEKVEDPKTVGIEHLQDQKDKQERKRQEELETVSTHLKKLDNVFEEFRIVARQDKEDELGRNFYPKVSATADRMKDLISRDDKGEFKRIEDFEKLMTDSLVRLGEDRRTAPNKETLRLFSKTRDALQNLRAEHMKLQVSVKQAESKDLAGHYPVVQRTTRKLDDAIAFLDKLHTAVARYLR